MLMGQTHESVVMGYDFISDFIYWRQPEKTLFLTKELCKASIGLCIGLYVIKIKYLLVLGLWGGVLSNSDFCVTLFTVFS